MQAGRQHVGRGGRGNIKEGEGEATFRQGRERQHIGEASKDPPIKRAHQSSDKGNKGDEG